MSASLIRRLLIAVGAATAAFFSPMLSANADDGHCMPVITPLDGPGFVRLEELAVEVHISCRDQECIAASTQRLFLANLDEVKAATLTVGTPQNCLASVDTIATQGAELIQQSRGHTLTLTPKGAATLTAVLSTPIAAAPILAGTIALSDTSAWGAIDHIHLEMELPAPAGPDRFLTPEPDALLHTSASWNWQGAAEDIHWALLSPHLAEEMTAAAKENDLLRLTEHLASATSSTSALPAWRDTTPRVLAILHGAIDRAPDRPVLRQALAEVYLSLADEVPGQRLNYLMLAIEQLDRLYSRPEADIESPTALASALYEAALAAHGQGDSGSALTYLNRAAEIAPNERIRRAQQEFVLRWGLDLAQLGEVSQAISLIGESGQSSLAAELVRFAPPIEHARIQASLSPSTRTVEYALSLYEPSSSETDTAIDDALRALSGLPNTEIIVEPPAANLREFSVSVSYQELTDLQAQRERVVDELALAGGLVAEIIAAPWHGQTLRYEMMGQPWQRELTYAESVDSTKLLAAWRTDADYAHWWLMEKRSQQGSPDADQTETELVMLALGEQMNLWESLPESIRWSYRLERPEIGEAPQWRVFTGQRRELTYRQTWYEWDAIERMGIAAVGIIIGLSLSLLLLRSRRRAKRANRSAS